MGRATRLEINTSALKQNITELQKINGEAFFCPMVKANAYGHGVSIVAPALANLGLKHLGVALIEEAVELREMGVSSEILVFAPLNPGDHVNIIAKKLTPVVGRFADLEELAKIKSAHTIHLKFNTGMQRLGFDDGDLAKLKARLSELPNLKVTGVSTHLTHGDESIDPSGPTHMQFKKFLQMSDGFPGVRHAHKSASLDLLAKEKFFPQVGARPGISIYGLPHDGRKVGAGLKPVAAWRSELSHIHLVEKGASVSYGGRWVAPRRSKIAVVPVGYGDGYSRLHSNKGRMIFRNSIVPVIGSVCMDYTLIDLTDASAEGEPRPGETVTLIGSSEGKEILAVDLAEETGTIAYETLTAITSRVQRVSV